MLLVGDERLERALELVIGMIIIAPMYLTIEFLVRTGYLLDSLILYLMIVVVLGSLFLLPAHLVCWICDKLMERN